MDAATTADILGGDYQPLALIDNAPPVARGPAPVSEALALSAPAPNPVRGRASVAYRLSASGEATLAAYDVSGRQVAVLARGPHAAGEHTATFDASHLASGVYVLRLEGDSGSATQRATVVR